ncbi:MAG: phage holin family protein [Acetobacter persici]|uniref:phage holin family protein n=1 Tax=Acetobacter persici TaxID=1076596 RepID=UPI0039EAA74B
MRIFELGRSALHAQSHLMQQMAIRLGKQAAFLVAAVVFGFFALISGHGLLWALFLFTFHWGPVTAAFGVFALDVIFALICVLFGRRSYLTTAEVEARIARNRCATQMRESVTLAAVTATVAGSLGRSGTRKVWDVVRRKKN